MDRAHRTPLALAILSVLHNQPRHPYEIRQLIRQRHLDESIRASGGSIYHTIERLMRAGLVELVGQERVGHRPERSTYALTPAGRHEFMVWLHDLAVEVRPEYPSFGAALTFAPHLPPAALRGLLVERDRRLTAVLAETDPADVSWASRRGDPPPSLDTEALRDVPRWPPRLMTLDREYTHAMHRAERDWVRTIIAEIDRGDLAWPRFVRDWQARWGAEAPHDEPAVNVGTTGPKGPDSGPKERPSSRS